MARLAFHLAVLAVALLVANCLKNAVTARLFYKSLNPIPRVLESSLSPEDFVEFYVKPGIPVIIVHDVDGITAAESAEIKSLLLSRCGDRPVNLLSATIQTFVSDMDPPVRRVFDLALRLFNGVDLDTWLMERKARTLRDLDAAGAKSGGEGKVGGSFLAEMLLPATLHRLLSLTFLPPYLSDVHPKEICGELLSRPKNKHDTALGSNSGHSAHQQSQSTTSSSSPSRRLFSKFVSPTRYEDHVSALLSSSPYPGPALGPWSLFSEHSFDTDDKFFWGGDRTSSYPLHRDVNDADAVFSLSSGCKEFVIAPHSERHLLSRLPIPGFQAWQDDLFRFGRPPGSSSTLWWSGAAYGGETMYLPGELLHEVRNCARDTIAMCRRPWRASAARDIARDARELYREGTYEELVNRNWLYWTIDRAERIGIWWRAHRGEDDGRTTVEGRQAEHRQHFSPIQSNHHRPGDDDDADSREKYS